MGTRIYVGGTFDLFHYGHVEFLKRAAALGSVTVALNRDEFCARYKRRPICSYAERAAVLEACKYVERVVCNFGDENSRPVIDTVRPVALVYAGWSRADYLYQMSLDEDWLALRNIGLVELDYTEEISTSEIIGRVRADIHSDRR